MQYKNYKVEDFLFDEFFVRWVKKPGPETEHFWEAWIENHPGQLHVINQAREIVMSIEPQRTYEPSDEDYDEVLENILKEPESWTNIGYRKRSDYLTKMTKYAALFIILLSLGALIGYVQLQQPKPIEQVRIIKKVNPVGQKTTFVLADGTKVKLNAGSTLSYPDNFSGDLRKVVLSGEAFFDVKRYESQPFIVETSDLTTTVLGTSFNVRCYPDEAHSSVAVSSGKVKVKKVSDNPALGDSQSFLLERNQMVRYNESDKSLDLHETVPGNTFSWTENTIMFRGEQPDEIFRTLSRWYGVEFVVASSKQLEGGFFGKYTNESLEIVLNGLKDQYRFEYKFIEGGSKVLIH